MIAANFTGGEAEELRRAIGFKRSQARMKEVEAKLRAGMTQNKIPPKAQEEIIVSITWFALYGFPVARRQLRADRLRQRLSEMPLFRRVYRRTLSTTSPWISLPATIVKDAQRHGLKITAGRCDEVRVDLHVGDSSRSPFQSEGRHSPAEGRKKNGASHRPALCSRVAGGSSSSVGSRTNFLCAFVSIHDLTRRVPELRKDELTTLAEIGALIRSG